jgi:hypothetical protein
MVMPTLLALAVDITPARQVRVCDPVCTVCTRMPCPLSRQTDRQTDRLRHDVVAAHAWHVATDHVGPLTLAPMAVVWCVHRHMWMVVTVPRWGKHKGCIGR